MTKVIRVTVNNKTEEVEMDSEEMLKRFDNMFNKFAHLCKQRTAGYQGCVEEFDDYKQIAIIKAIEKFETYDLSKDANFSTLLVKVFRELVIDIIRKNESKMRKNKSKLVFIDAPMKSGDSISETVSQNSGDIYFKNDATDLEKLLAKHLTKEEIMLYTIDLKKQINKVSPKQKVCIQHTIDSLTSIVGYIPDKKEELAIILDMSRPTLNKRIGETITKVKKLATEFCSSNKPLTKVSS